MWQIYNASLGTSQGIDHKHRYKNKSCLDKVHKLNDDTPLSLWIYEFVIELFCKSNFCIMYKRGNTCKTRAEYVKDWPLHHNRLLSVYRSQWKQGRPLSQECCLHSRHGCRRFLSSPCPSQCSVCPELCTGPRFHLNVKIHRKYTSSEYSLEYF